MKNNFLTRTLVAVPIFGAFILSLIFQNWYFKIFITLLMIIAQYEINKAIKSKIDNINVVIPYIAVIAIPIVAFTWGISPLVWVYILTIFAYILELILNKKRDIQSFIFNIFTLIYPSILLTCVFTMNIGNSNSISRMMLILAFFTAMVTDVCAYIFGSLFGKTKLCPHISPKKSVEGAVWGYLLGFASIVLIGLFAQNLIGTNIDIIHFIILGATIPALVQFGDLFASMVKRYFGIKDFGAIFPGHGGIMDRFDSGLFVCPIVYFYFQFVII